MKNINILNKKILRSFSSFSLLSFLVSSTYMSLSVFGKVGFATNGSSAIGTSERG